MLGAAKHEYWDCWALIWPDGQLFVDTDGTCPADCWKIGLGWPDAAEIEHAKAKGVRCVLVKVRAPAAPNANVTGTGKRSLTGSGGQPGSTPGTNEAGGGE